MDGTSLEVIVPRNAATGDIRVINAGVSNLGFSPYADSIYRKVTVSFTASGMTSTLRFADLGLEGVGNESWGLDNVVVADGAATVFADNFEAGAIENWSDKTVNADAQGVFTKFSGQFSKSQQNLNLTGLTAGKTYTLSFDFYALDSWDGLAQDRFQVSADGHEVFNEAFANVSPNNGSAQTYNASAGARLLSVPTLSGFWDMFGRPAGVRPGKGSSFDLLGSGFIEGGSTVTIGGITISEATANQPDLDVWEGNSHLTVNADVPTLEGPIRVTTDGGYAQIAGPVFGTPAPVTFSGIQAAALQGVAANTALPSANAGQTITLVGQGFTSNTLVQFAAVDDTGVAGMLTRTGVAANGGTTLSVVVPALAKTGAVKVLGSNAGYQLQVVPVLRSVGGTITAGQTIMLDGTGFVASELQIAIDGIGVGQFSLRTVTSDLNDGYGQKQQVLTVTTPDGVSAGAITVSTKGGNSALKLTTSVALKDKQMPTGDVGDTLTSATAVTLAQNSAVTLAATIGDGAGLERDVDLYAVTVAAGDQLSFARTGSRHLLCGDQRLPEQSLRPEGRR